MDEPLQGSAPGLVAVAADNDGCRGAGLQEIRPRTRARSSNAYPVPLAELALSSSADYGPAAATQPREAPKV